MTNPRSGQFLIGVSLLTLFLGIAVAEGAPDNFGTQNVTWYRISAAEFMPVNTAVAPWTSWNPGADYTFRTWGSGGWLFAAPHLPAGALLTSLELDACDTNGTGN